MNPEHFSIDDFLRSESMPFSTDEVKNPAAHDLHGTRFLLNSFQPESQQQAQSKSSMDVPPGLPSPRAGALSDQSLQASQVAPVPSAASGLSIPAAERPAVLLSSSESSKAAGDTSALTITSNYERFLQDYDILRVVPTDDLVVPATTEPVARVFVDFQCMETKTRTFVLLTHPFEYIYDAEWLWKKGFVKLSPLKSNDRHSFAAVFSDWNRVQGFLRNVQYVAKVGLKSALLHFGLNFYLGKVLHVTSGSGKTTLRCSCPSYPIVDTDDIVIQQITQQFPCFRLKKVSASENIFKFCKNMKPREVSSVFDAVRSKALRFRAEGYVVLSGTVSLIDIADYVLVQRNSSILQQYDVHRELEAANYFGKSVTFIDDYLSNVLSCRTEQL